jgi:hypothetical protein
MRCPPDRLFPRLHHSFQRPRPLHQRGNHATIQLAVEHQAHEAAVLPSDDRGAASDPRSEVTAAPTAMRAEQFSLAPPADTSRSWTE